MILLSPKIGLIGFFIIWVSSIFIDVDHYIYYVWKKRDLNLKRAFDYFAEASKKAMKLPRSERWKKRANPCIFHGIEAIILLIFLSFFHVFFLYILLGFIFHEFLDFLHILYYGFNFNHIGSQTLNILRLISKK